MSWQKRACHDQVSFGPCAYLPRPDTPCRNNIIHSSKRLRRIISAPEFVRYFGAAKPQSQDGRNNIFGRDDELKMAPKGVAKDHPCVIRLWLRPGLV